MYNVNVDCSTSKEGNGGRRKGDLFTEPRYASMAADFIRSTGLTGQYQAFGEDQSYGFTMVRESKHGMR